MQPFLFVIEVKPLPENPQGAMLGGAKAHVWVFDQSLEEAAKKASRFIAGYGWEEVRVESSYSPSQEQLACFDGEELHNYRQAELYGLAGQFLAWPAEHCQGEYSVEPLRKPRS